MRLCEFERDGTIRQARTDATAYIVSIRPAARWRADDAESARTEYARVVQLLHLPLAGGADDVELQRDLETGEDLGWLASYMRRREDGWRPPRDSPVCLRATADGRTKVRHFHAFRRV
jgi:diadenosine tetraphosphatase ApaH/serine/threonine PP2A family protein phosphatase